MANNNNQTFELVAQIIDSMRKDIDKLEDKANECSTTKVGTIRDMERLKEDLNKLEDVVKTKWDKPKLITIIVDNFWAALGTLIMAGFLYTADFFKKFLALLGFE